MAKSKKRPVAKVKPKTVPKNKSSRDKATKSNQAKAGIGFMIAGILLGVFMFIGEGAPLNNLIRELLTGLFGKPAVAVPFMLCGLGIYILNDGRRAREKGTLSFLCLVCVSALFHLCIRGEIINLTDSFPEGSATDIVYSLGGGFFGCLLAYPLSFLVHRVGAFILILFMLLLFISLLTHYSIFAALFGGVRGVFGAVRESARDIDMHSDYEKAYEKSKQVTKKVRQRRENGGDELINVANDFARELSAGETAQIESAPAEKKKKAEKEPAEKPTKEKVTAEFETGIDKVFKDIFEKKQEAENEAEEASDITEQVQNQAQPENVEEADEEEMSAYDEPIAEAGTPKKKRVDELTVEEEEEYSNEINEQMEAPPVEYIFPDTELLNEVRQSAGDSRQQMYETSNKLISILGDFGVKAKLLQVTQGPAVTRYEILPNTGVKLSKIVGLADDLALNLAVSTVLVAPVPGKAAVGIEIPNKETSAVSARELLESDDFVNSKSKLTIALGRDIGGRVVVGDIAKMPHMLIAGSTGSGKSVCINTIITSLLFKASPDEVKLIMVDPKVVELGVYNGIPHLLIPVVTDPKKAAGALNWAVSEMMRRYDIFAENAVKNLHGYNLIMENQGKAKLPQIVIIIDELADLMMVAAKEVEDYICRLAQLARAAGIHLIVATQRPTVDVITGLIKANIPSRIAFAVASQVDSRTIIDRAGADKLLGKGDMLYAPQGCRSPIRVQGAYVADDEIERLLDFLKGQNEDAHYSEDLEEHIERVSTGENGVTPDTDDDGDELLPQAIELAIELGQISTAMIQRRLKVGYSRAGRIIDQMEERGIIGPANGSKPRQVYVSHADL